MRRYLSPEARRIRRLRRAARRAYVAQWRANERAVRSRGVAA
jgi:hypothetical protein